MVSEIPFLSLPFQPHCYVSVSKPSPPKFASCWAQTNSLLTTATFIHSCSYTLLLRACGLRAVLVVKNPPASEGDVRDAVLAPGSGRSPGGGHGNPLQYSCLENPMDREPYRLQSLGSQSWT